jgi:hypothetical protein
MTARLVGLLVEILQPRGESNTLSSVTAPTVAATPSSDSQNSAKERSAERYVRCVLGAAWQAA